ncbi:MAG: glycosyl hydrolase-related protein, partial [Phycisphaerae bacterium]
LLRSSYDPDIYPDQGLHRIKYALYPHAGDWKSGVWEEGEAFNSPALATEPPSAALGKSHATRPEEDALLSLEPAHVRLSGVKEAEEGGEVVVRFAEIEGRRGVAVLTLPVPVKCARRFDLIERPLEGVAAPKVSGRSVRVDVRPHEIITLGLEV